MGDALFKGVPLEMQRYFTGERLDSDNTDILIEFLQIYGGIKWRKHLWAKWKRDRMFRKAIVEIDKTLETFPDPQRSYYSSMVAGLYFAIILMIPVFLFLLGVMIIYHESVFTIQNLLRLVFAIIVLDAMRNSGSKWNASDSQKDTLEQK